MSKPLKLMTSSQDIPSKEALALAEALKRDRSLPPSHPRATIEDICKALGAERIYTSKGNAKPGVTMFIKRPQD
jgi:hypothetical protein